MTLYSDFCGLYYCPKCFKKERPFPMENPDKKRVGQVCVVCNTKFLYRDAMYELMNKLEARDINKQQLQG